MTDSGKHSALRQTSDGSFEIVFDREGLQEISEEISVAEVSAPEPLAPKPRTSNRVLAFSVGGVALLLVAAAIGWLALTPGKKAANDSEEVAGFRPYGGGGGEAAGAAKRATPPKDRAAQLAAAVAAEEQETEPAEEITESEPGWELSEANESGVVVEVEGEDPEPEVAEVEVVEVEEEAEAEPVPVDETDERVRAFTGRNGLRGLRGTDLGRNFKAPRVPSLNPNPMATERLKALPLRNIGANDAAEEEDVIEDDHVVEEEEVEVEVEDEVIDEE